MAHRKKFRAYLRALEELKARQLDVYRYKDHDELRLLHRGRVVIVKLPKHREEMSVEEFKQLVSKALSGGSS